MIEPAPRLRRPTEEDHGALTAAAEAWLGERRPRPILPRRWLRDFAGTSWLAEEVGGTPIGFAVAYHAPGRAEEAALVTLAVAPSARRRGIGRALVDQVAADARAAGRGRIVAVVWPGDPVCLRFLRALGFVAEAGHGSQRLYGIDAFADYDGPGEDRAILTLEL